MGDCTGNHYRDYEGETRSLDYSFRGGVTYLGEGKVAVSGMELSCDSLDIAFRYCRHAGLAG